MSQYDKYKPSNIKWIGEIPEHWLCKRLKYEALIQPSNVDKKTIEGETPVFLCNYMDVYKNDFIDDTIKFMEATATENEIDKFLLREGDVLVTKDSETPDDIANPAYVVNNFDNVICAYHLAQIRSNGTLSGRYLFRLFQNHQFKAQFEVEANGITRYGLSVSAFTNAYIPLPSVDEQVYISNYLDEKTAQIDKLVNNKKQLIEILNEEKRIIIDSTVNGLGKDWTKKKLKYVAKMQGGFAFKSDDFVKEGIQLIRIGNLYQNEFSLNRQPAYLPDEYLEKYPDWAVSDGDILMSMTGTLGKRDYGFAILISNTGKKYLLNQRVSKVLFDEKEILKEFGILILRSGKYLDQLFLLPTGTKQGNFSNEQVLSIPIEYPNNLDVQKAIIREVIEIERKFEDTLQKIELEIQLMQEYKTALISEVVTGKQKII